PTRLERQRPRQGVPLVRTPRTLPRVLEPGQVDAKCPRSRSNRFRPCPPRSRGPGGVELACHPGETRDRPVALPIGLERLQGELGAPRAPTPFRPVDAVGHRPLPLWPAFDDGADGQGCYFLFFMVFFFAGSVR